MGCLLLCHSSVDTRQFQARGIRGAQLVYGFPGGGVAPNEEGTRLFSFCISPRNPLGGWDALDCLSLSMHPNAQRGWELAS